MYSPLPLSSYTSLYPTVTTLIHSFTHSFNKYAKSTYSGPGTLETARKYQGIKQSNYIYEANYSSGGRQAINKELYRPRTAMVYAIKKKKIHQGSKQNIQTKAFLIQ